MSDDLLKSLLELRINQFVDSDTAPEFVFLDPDIPPSEWEKQYAMDVVYVRGDVMWLNLKDQADRIEELESLVKDLFVLLDKTEETDEGRVFHPNRIYSCRALDAEKLEGVLADLKRTLKGDNG